MELKVEHIKKSYKKTHVLKDVSFEAHDGECIAFTGDNGSGKTTFLSILVGVEKADAGSVILDGKKVTGDMNGNSRLGFVPQINPLPDNLKVKECLRLWCDDKESFEYISKRYNLVDILDKKISKLSGGMKRRVAIACAMATNPEILVMDEPTAALDVKYKTLIHKDMRRFVEDGGLLIMVTHEREEMEMCNRCYRLVKGRNEEV